MRNRSNATLAVAFLLLLAAARTLVAQGNPTDPKHLPLGDGRVSSTPVRGSVWSCNAQFDGRGGAHAVGSWIKSDGTYDFTAKPTVDGSVQWPHSFTISRLDAVRRITGNDLPDHPTGTFPVSTSDDAYNFDRNPNSIRAQTLTLDMPVDPVAAARASCLPMGPIGVLWSGGYFFNALDLRGEDAVAHEIQDACQGHPQGAGAYHYHNLSSCVKDAAAANTHSALVGYAFDGFGIFGKRGEGGKLLSNSDLDECHGHTHTIEWDGRQTSMYHYHATWEYPYTVGCFRGTPSQNATQQARGAGRAGQRAGRAGRAAAAATTNSTQASSNFSVVTLGTGAPRYDSTRAGASNAIRMGDRYIIVDVGNGAQARLQQAGIAPNSIDAIMITHHHLDHDQELMPLIITTMVRGSSPEIIGSPGTVSMVNFMKDFYAEDIAYRMDRAPGVDVDPNSLKVRDLKGGEQFNVGAASVRTAQVNHSIYTVAYRFDFEGKSIVISGDLTYSPSLIDLARNADVLVIDAGGLPGTDGVAARAGRAGRPGGAPPGGAARAGRAAARGGAAAQDRAHPTTAEVAQMATQAGVRCLVLSHIGITNVDVAATLSAFQPLYKGKVVVASDLGEVSSDCAVTSRK